jgi:hypothetical protein
VVIDVRGEEVRFDIGDDDFMGETFIVGVDRRHGYLDFRTAFVPEPGYLKQVKKGKLLWKARD